MAFALPDLPYPHDIDKKVSEYIADIRDAALLKRS